MASKPSEPFTRMRRLPIKTEHPDPIRVYDGQPLILEFVKFEGKHEYPQSFEVLECCDCGLRHFAEFHILPGGKMRLKLYRLPKK